MKQIRKLVILVAVSMTVLAAFHPGARHRSDLVWRKLTGQAIMSWPQLIVEMTPGTRLRAKLREITGFQPGHWVQKLEFESNPGWATQMHPIVDRPTSTMPQFECHLSDLQPRRMPHAIHQHPPEEIIVPLAGKIVIIRGDDPNRVVSETIGRGQFAYHAANQPHTLRNNGPQPAKYLVLKWGQIPAERTETTLDSANFDFRPALLSHDGAAKKFTTTLLFEGPTRHLGKLHSHASTLQPGGGYNPHSDSYDIAMVLLTGAVQTVGYNVEAPSMIFYAADQPHGIKNIGSVRAQYIVFEFHGQTTRQ